MLMLTIDTWSHFSGLLQVYTCYFIHQFSVFQFFRSFVFHCFWPLASWILISTPPIAHFPLHFSSPPPRCDICTNALLSNVHFPEVFVKEIGELHTLPEFLTDSPGLLSPFLLWFCIHAASSIADFSGSLLMCLLPTSKSSLLPHLHSGTLYNAWQNKGTLLKLQCLEVLRDSEYDLFSHT